MRQVSLRTFGLAFIALGAACATISPASRIQSRLMELGVPRSHAGCLADELDDRLDRSELSDVARFLDRVSRADSGDDVVGQLRRIDNPRVAAMVAASAIACALGG